MWLKKAKPGGGVVTDLTRDVGLMPLAVIQEWKDPVLEHSEKIYRYIYTYT